MESASEAPLTPGGKHAVLILLTFGILFSYVAYWASALAPFVYARGIGIRNDQIRDFLPGISFFVGTHAWIFVVLIALVTAGATVLHHVRPAQAVPWTVAGLAAQGLILWLCAFCNFYDAFLGGGDLYMDPTFDPRNFLTLMGGAFPITLAAILITLIAALFRRGKVSV